LYAGWVQVDKTGDGGRSRGPVARAPGVQRLQCGQPIRAVGHHLGEAEHQSRAGGQRAPFDLRPARRGDRVLNVGGPGGGDLGKPPARGRVVQGQRIAALDVPAVDER
jgi:hypothetical protein